MCEIITFFSHEDEIIVKMKITLDLIPFSLFLLNFRRRQMQTNLFRSLGVRFSMEKRDENVIEIMLHLND